MKNKIKNNIPAYVSGWTDKYFHQSAFGVPLKCPSKKIIEYLNKYKDNRKIRLYRGLNKYNKLNYSGVESWTYKKNIANRYADKISGEIIEKLFKPKNILLDTTLLNSVEKIMLGYDYAVDDREVLILL
ncbi:MAG: hypothetical protein Q8O93_02300 [bacterium]|nr:hypothetical protein [bacterium]